MIQVSKSEAFAMRKKGLEKHIKSSHSRYKKYYMVEDPRSLAVLENYRKEKVVKEKLV